MSLIPANEKIVETKTCHHCGAPFDITDKDLEFYDKISPVFGGVKYPIPSPTFCPDCRQQRRLSFKNERKLYKRKCNKTEKDIISMYSPDKPYKIYEQNEWWSDKWNPLDYGEDFNFDKSFFVQFGKLSLNIPHPSLITVSNHNSEYTNFTDHLKNCYLVFITSFAEDCYYSCGADYSKNTIDNENSVECKECYEITHCKNCFGVCYSRYSNDCSNSSYLTDCDGCTNCLFCMGLKNKSYCILNKEYPKEEYEKIKNNKNFINALFKKFHEIVIKFPRKHIYGNTNENCVGDFINNSKNIYNSYTTFHCEDSKYLYDVLEIRDSYDLSSSTINSFIYEGDSIVESFSLLSCYSVINSSKLYYCFGMLSSSNCFGCIGLKNKSYCIFNKQYTKEEYEGLVPKIIEYMKETGEWGEFFPSSISPFGYNETVAQEYFPLSRDVAVQHLYNWSDYEPPFPKVEKIIPAAKLPDDIAKIPDDILNWAIECEVTGKPFRIIRQELEFYRKHNIPIPRRHPDQRHLDRMSLRNPRKLYNRKCDKCGVEMMTTYDPERPEIIYCEGCYEKEVY